MVVGVIFWGILGFIFGDTLGLFGLFWGILGLCEFFGGHFRLSFGQFGGCLGYFGVIVGCFGVTGVILGLILLYGFFWSYFSYF